MKNGILQISDSAVCRTLQSQVLWLAGHRGIRFCVEKDTAESAFGVSTTTRSQPGREQDTAEWDFLVSRALQSQTLLWAGYCGVRLFGEQDTSEPDSVVSRIPRSETLWWAGHFRVRLCWEQDTEESDSMGSWTPQSQTLLWAGHHGVGLCGVQQDTTESGWAFFVLFFCELSNSNLFL